MKHTKKRNKMYIVAVKWKKSIEKILTLQEKAKTLLPLSVSQCKEILFEVILEHFDWSIGHDFFLHNVKDIGLLKWCRKLKISKNDVTWFSLDSGFVILIIDICSFCKEKLHDLNNFPINMLSRNNIKLDVNFSCNVSLILNMERYYLHAYNFSHFKTYAHIPCKCVFMKI